MRASAGESLHRQARADYARAQMVVRCTKRLLDLLGAAVIPAERPPDHDDWYANLLWIDRRKCLLVVHAGTLFPVFRADIRVDQLRPLGLYVVRAIAEELHAEGLPPAALGLLDAEDVHVARTASRSVLGFMNEMAFHVRHQIELEGGLDLCDIRVLNHGQRRTLHNRDGVYAKPLDLVAHLRGPLASSAAAGSRPRRRLAP